MLEELALVHAEHAGIGQDRRRDLAHALIDVEEHDEEDEREAERHLRPDAESEPEREDRRQHDAGQGVRRLDIGVEHRGKQLPPREGEAEQDAGQRTDHEGQHRLGQGDAEMVVDVSAGELLEGARQHR